MALAWPWFVVGVCAWGAVIAVHAQGGDVAAAAAESCAGVVAQHRPPMYPIDLLSREVTGTTTLALHTDACGRVTDASVEKSSGHKQFDQAALEAVRHWVLTADERERGVDGVVTWPVVFKIDNSIAEPKAPDWPGTHRHVRWVFDETAKEYADAAVAEDAVDAKPGMSDRLVPFRIPGSSFVQLDTTNGREFWYFIDTIDNEQKPLVAVHYQPVFDNGEPIVRLSMYCDDTAPHCAAYRKLFMRGLDYARPK
jgi:TonB family protein